MLALANQSLFIIIFWCNIAPKNNLNSIYSNAKLTFDKKYSRDTNIFLLTHFFNYDIVLEKAN